MFRLHCMRRKHLCWPLVTECAVCIYILQYFKVEHMPKTCERDVSSHQFRAPAVWDRLEEEETFQILSKSWFERWFKRKRFRSVWNVGDDVTGKENGSSSSEMWGATWPDRKTFQNHVKCGVWRISLGYHSTFLHLLSALRTEIRRWDLRLDSWDLVYHEVWRYFYLLWELRFECKL